MPAYRGRVFSGLPPSIQRGKKIHLQRLRQPLQQTNLENRGTQRKLRRPPLNNPPPRFLRGRINSKTEGGNKATVYNKHSGAGGSCEGLFGINGHFDRDKNIIGSSAERLFGDTVNPLRGQKGNIAQCWNCCTGDDILVVNKSITAIAACGGAAAGRIQR